jgi:hypothetical protein
MSTKRGVFCRVCFLFSHILLTEVFAGCVSEDNDKDNDNDDNEEENNDKDTDNEEKDNSNKDNKNEYNKNRSINDDNKDNIMPPRLKQASMLPTKATKKEPGVEKLTSAISKMLKITTLPFKPYSMKTLDGYMVKPYTQKFIDYVEVDIHFAGPLPEHAYKAKLSEDGMSFIWRRAIPEFFSESKRMVSMLKKAYHSDDLHVIAHNNIVQQIQKGGTESKGLHFAAEEDTMIVQLVECTDNVRVKETLQKVDEVVYNGSAHYQFNTIYSYKVQTMKLWTTKKKKVRRSDHVNIDKRSAEENSDGDDDDDKEMAPVGSTPPK